MTMRRPAVVATPEAAVHGGLASGRLAHGIRIDDFAGTVARELSDDEVLATTSLVVGHGGHGTSMRALSFGVPLVIMPANALIDQKRVGAVIQQHGAGLLLRKHSRPARIRAAIDTVLTDPAYRESAGRLGDRIRERDGAQVAADAISELAGAHT